MKHWLTYGSHRARSKAAGLVTAMALAVGAAVPMAAVAQQTDILALGDSLTQGYGLPDQDGFVPQLRVWLETRGHDVRVVNGGVSGDTTAGGLSRVEWSLTPEIEAMIVALGANDLLRGIDPATARDNLEGILRAAVERDVAVLLIGMEAPGNYGQDYKDAFDAIYPDLAEKYDTLHLDSFFAGILDDGETLADAERFMQSDGIHPNAEGVTRIVEEIGPKVEMLIARTESGSGG